MMKLAVGETVRGYRITRYLGRGGFASVYLAEQEVTGTKVALKVGGAAGGGRQVTRLVEVTSRRTAEGISPDELPAEAVFFEPNGVRIDLFDESEVNNLLRAEGELLAGCGHENLVPLLDRLDVDGSPVLVLEYVRGKTLREKIRSLEGIHLNWFLAIVRALLTMQQTDQLAWHGDLKPENIVVKPSGKVVMLDPAMRTAENKVVTTTPHYNPLLLTDSKADVMAIGIMIYEILTGTLPFDEVPWEFAGRQTGGETQRLSLSYFFSYTPPHTLNPKTPDELEKIVYRCITVPGYGLEQLKADLEAFISKA
jgi:serine/threonine protein kinase